MIPRDIFEGFDKPLVIAQFRKEHVRRLHGMAFYQEIADERSFPSEFRAILARAEKNVWTAACLRALEHLGGTGSVDQITRVISGARPTRTEHWREAVRKHLRLFFERVETGIYTIPSGSGLRA
jgi:site-specific DNA-methyltransferase (adenine-specific)